MNKKHIIFSSIVIVLLAGIIGVWQFRQGLRAEAARFANCGIVVLEADALYSRATEKVQSGILKKGKSTGKLDVPTDSFAGLKSTTELFGERRYGADVIVGLSNLPPLLLITDGRFGVIIGKSSTELPKFYPGELGRKDRVLYYKRTM